MNKRERNRTILQMRQNGHTLQQIADRFGLTREGVRMIGLSLSGFPNTVQTYKTIPCKNCGKGVEVRMRKLYCSQVCKDIAHPRMTPEEKRHQNRERARRYYETEHGKKTADMYRLRMKDKNRLKVNARSRVNYHVRIGNIKKPASCEICGRKASEDVKLTGHHEDYSKALEVIWCCRLCHAKLDKDMKIH